MIDSILDTDLYKLSMQNAILELFPDTLAEYSFQNRNLKYEFSNLFLLELQDEINKMTSYSLSNEEYKFLKEKCVYLKPSYLEYLYNYRFDSNEIQLSIDDNQLKILIKGLWCRTVLWEVPLMALISELYFKKIKDWNIEGTKERTIEKADILSKYNCKTSEFGTRRRRSYETQSIVVDVFKNYSNFVGTSNVNLAMKYNVKPIGTVAHEFIMAMSVLHGLRHANRFAMDAWTQVYKANLGTALTDTYGIDAFFKDFSLYHSKLWSDVRQDSGDPFVFVDKTVEHYRKMNIDPLSKAIIFSDSLNVDKCVKLNEYCKNKIRCSFGIGTNLTNDFPDKKYLNMVIKLKTIDGIPVIKLSEDINKSIGDKDAIRVAKWTFFGQNLEKS